MIVGRRPGKIRHATRERDGRHRIRETRPGSPLVGEDHRLVVMHRDGDVRIGRHFQIIYRAKSAPSVRGKIHDARGVTLPDRREHPAVEKIELLAGRSDRLVENLEPKPRPLIRKTAGEAPPEIRDLLPQRRVLEYPSLAAAVEVGPRQEMHVEHHAKPAGPRPANGVIDRGQLRLVERAVGIEAEAAVDGQADVIETLLRNPRHIPLTKPRGRVGQGIGVLREPVGEVDAPLEGERPPRSSPRGRTGRATG